VPSNRDLAVERPAQRDGDGRTTCRLVLIDPKQVELNHYEVDPAPLDAGSSRGPADGRQRRLQNLVREMEQRYSIMSFWRKTRLARGAQPLAAGEARRTRRCRTSSASSTSLAPTS